MGGLGDDISKGVFRAVLGEHRGGNPGVSGIGRGKKHWRWSPWFPGRWWE